MPSCLQSLGLCCSVCYRYSCCFRWLVVRHCCWCIHYCCCYWRLGLRCPALSLLLGKVGTCGPQTWRLVCTAAPKEVRKSSPAHQTINHCHVMEELTAYQAAVSRLRCIALCSTNILLACSFHLWSAASSVLGNIADTHQHSMHYTPQEGILRSV